MSFQKHKVNEQTEINGDFYSNPNLEFKKMIIKDNKNSGDNAVFEIFKSLKIKLAALRFCKPSATRDSISTPA